MKLALIAVLAATVSTAALANDFNNTHLSVTARSGAFAFTVDGDQTTGYTNMEIRSQVLTYSMGENIDSTLDLFVGHNRVLNEMTAGAEYTMTYMPGAMAVYGSAQLSYTAATANLGNGNVFVTPTIGASYQLGRDFTMFSELSYTWNASNSWNSVGGAVELGLDYAVNDAWTITPSLVRTFGTTTDNTQLHISTQFNF
jgi:outer membrane protein W